MKTYGLIGFPLDHSFSEAYFKEKFEREHIKAQYLNFPLHDLDDFPDFLRHTQPDGLNVTIPYKERIIRHLQKLDPLAEEVGAVNCIQIRNGQLKGFNTDVLGFEQTLLPLCEHPVPALVFGTGGASKAVCYVLEKHQFPYRMVSRNEILNGYTYDELTRAVIEAHPLLINTTPVGTFPDNEACLPLAYKWVNAGHIAYDLIYNPERTRFLTYCEAEGARIQNGRRMLEIQAEASYRIFTGEIV